LLTFIPEEIHSLSDKLATYMYHLSYYRQGCSSVITIWVDFRGY
jgi:hypothetical protein